MISLIEGYLASLSNQTRGTFYCLLAIAILIPDSLVVRELSNVPDFAVIFLRYIIFASTYIVVYIAKEGRNFFKSFASIGWMGWLAGLVWGVSNFCITYSFMTTAIANALVINSANPMFSALFSWVILRETVPMRTILASVVCFGAIVLIFYSQIGGASSASNTTGMICAMIASASMGLYFVILRMAAGTKGEEPDMLPCNIIAGLFVSIIAISVSQDMGEITPKDLSLLLLNGVFILPVSFALFTIGPSLISAPEVSLYTLIETVIGPVLVWLAGYEAPPFSAVYGGTILIITLAIHSVIAIKEEQEKARKGQQLKDEDDNEHHEVEMGKKNQKVLIQDEDEEATTTNTANKKQSSSTTSPMWA